STQKPHPKYPQQPRHLYPSFSFTLVLSIYYFLPNKFGSTILTKCAPYNHQNGPVKQESVQFLFHSCARSYNGITLTNINQRTALRCYFFSFLFFFFLCS